MAAMRIPINLASEPFRRDRPVLVASAALGIVLVITLLAQVGVILTKHGESARIRVTLNQLETHGGLLGHAQTKLDTTLREPGNAVVLERSVFLNGLIERKGISWTQIFADLGKVMPPDVKLVSVRLPQITSQNKVLLDMQVGAKSYLPVVELLRHLEAAKEFGPAAVITSTPPSQNDSLWKYRVNVSYAQNL